MMPLESITVAAVTSIIVLRQRGCSAQTDPSISIRPAVDWKIWSGAAEWGFVKDGHNQVLRYGALVC